MALFRMFVMLWPLVSTMRQSMEDENIIRENEWGAKCCQCGPPKNIIKWSKSGTCSLCGTGEGAIVRKFDPPSKCAKPANGASWEDNEQRGCHAVCRTRLSELAEEDEADDDEHDGDDQHDDEDENLDEVTDNETGSQTLDEVDDHEEDDDEAEDDEHESSGTRTKTPTKTPTKSLDDADEDESSGSRGTLDERDKPKTTTAKPDDFATEFEDEDASPNTGGSRSPTRSGPKCCVCSTGVKKWSKSGSCSLCKVAKYGGKEATSKFDVPAQNGCDKARTFTDDEQRSCHKVCRIAPTVSETTKAPSNAPTQPVDDEEEFDDDEEHEDDDEEEHEDDDEEEHEDDDERGNQGGRGNSQTTTAKPDNDDDFDTEFEDEDASSTRDRSGGGPKCCTCKSGDIRWSKSGSCSLCKKEEYGGQAATSKSDPPSTKRCNEKLVKADEHRECHIVCEEAS